MTDVSARPELADLSAKYTADEGEFFFTGVQALVRLPFAQMRADRAAGRNTATFVSGYQGSPLGGLDRELAAQAELAERLHVVHKPGLNEELGATAVMGSQLSSTFADARYDGVLGIWYGKAPGLDRAGDAIRHANLAGTSRHGGVVALVGDDPACKSSTLPSASEFALEDLELPILYPGNVQEVLDFGPHAVALSRRAGLWTAMKIVTPVADGAATGVVGADRVRPVLPDLDRGGQPYWAEVRGAFIPPHSTELEREVREARLPLARAYAAANAGINEITADPPDAWLGVVAAGPTYHELVEAFRQLGLDQAALRHLGVRLLRVGMLFPLDRDLLRRFARGTEELLVVEEKRPFLEGRLRDVLYGMADPPRIVGKADPEGRQLVPVHGVLDADQIAPVLRARLARRVPADRLRPARPARAPHKGPLIELMPARSPYFCSGCPHNSSTKVPEGATVGAGIGCHGMVLLMDPARVGNVIGSTQMGGEGVQWIGIEPFVATDHLIQNVGDGTFFHSASLAIRAAVAADAHITYKILYNGTVAMTGGQDATGGVSVPNLVHMLRHEGVARLLITTDDPGAYKGVELPKGVEVWDRSRIVEAQEALASVPGVTVLVHDQGCAAEKRRDRKRGLVADPDTRIVINELVCEGCGDCGAKSNCLSVQPIETEFGRKTQIHQSSCNKDYSCLDGDCPSFLSVIPAKDSRFASRRSGRADRTKGGARRLPALDPAELRAPRPLVDADDVTVRMPGIGGTGVVTVNQILGTAAMLDGRYVSGLDQTGLSQKAGPVVSDLHISTRPLEGTNKASAGHVDCYLVFDLLVGLGAANLAGASPERTIAVVSTTATPTGSMVRDPSVAYPDEALMRAELDSVTRAADNVYLDAAAVADGLFGETTTSNVVVLGAAYQAGCLPVSAEAIESAIEVNGAAVEANRAAFRWGRMWVIDPDRVRAAMTPADASAPRPDAADLALIGDLDRGELGRLLRVRVPDLVAYQDRAYAERYVALVRTVAAAEDRAVPGATVLAETVARYYHKLLAYKDEYEVARLHLSSAARATVEREVGPGARVAYNLHPPMLRALGLDRKIRVGTWADPALGALARAKRLRGTPVDPFGYAKVRRVERRLAKEYGEVLAMVAARLDAADHGTAVALAALADQVRGYEDVKLRNVELYRREFDQLRRQLGV